MTRPEPELTLLLRQMRDGDCGAAERVIPLLYFELHNRAKRARAGQAGDHSLLTTDLVHEVFVKVCHGSGEIIDRNHFLRLAGTAMRCVLIDHARSKNRDKRAAPGRRVLLDHLVDQAEESAPNLDALNEALVRLEEVDPRAAKLVELRFFLGLEVPDAAEALGISERTASREWRTARAWLRKELGS